MFGFLLVLYFLWNCAHRACLKNEAGDKVFTKNGNKYQHKLYHIHQPFFKKELRILSVLGELAGQKGQKE